MFNKFKNLDPQTKLFIKATALIVAVNVVAIAGTKMIEAQSKNDLPLIEN